MSRSESTSQSLPQLAPITRIEIHTDGACSGNPGPGGWGAVIRFMSGDAIAERIELSEGEPDTTNNRMELKAVVSALECIIDPQFPSATPPITVNSDSEYVTKGFNEWLPNWRERGWKTAGKKPIKNCELWKALDELASRTHITLRWVRGHDGNVENEAADNLAVAAIPNKSR